MADLQTELNDLKRRVHFDTFDITTKELITMVSENVIDIAPAYQRQFRWKESNQSTFVESVFLGIPIPSLFTAANADGTWELIDGVQRLSTIIHFAGSDEDREKIGLSSALRLEGLRKLESFNGLTFEELPVAIQLKFRLIPVKITTISDKSDMEVRYDLFERLNTGGVRLEPQEIRSCIYRGRFAEFLSDFATDTNFRKVVRLPESMVKSAGAEEYVLRFFAYLNNYRNFDHSVIGFLNEYMGRSTKNFDYRKNEEIFDEVFSRLATLLPDGLIRGQKTRTPVNLFEAITVGAALAVENGHSLRQARLNELLRSSELKELTSAGSNNKPAVRRRIELCRDTFER